MFDFDKKKICLCTECGDDVLEGGKNYIDSEGNVFCSLECALDYHGISSMEEIEF